MQPKRFSTHALMADLVHLRYLESHAKQMIGKLLFFADQTFEKEK